ncbi:hypothetical protein OEZ86_007585 [Tetradesmus obliquus]|nr:hypothetical protein OEZ86_007585 [Tetradesmus obliquus]
MSGSSCSAVKGWLVGLRSLQIAAMLTGTAFLAMTLAYVGSAQQSGITIVELVSSLAAVALCIAWMVYTLKPAKRAQAGCCTNRDSCITFRYDVSWDGVFTVVYCVKLVAGVVQGATILAVVLNGVMMTLFIATALLSKKMGQQAREEQQGITYVTPVVAAAPAAAAGPGAPPKVVECV